MINRRKSPLSPGQWSVHREWHGIENHSPPAPANETHVGEVVPGLIKSMGLEDRLWEQTLINEWKSMVGEQVARHARPGRVHRKTLFVFVSNSVWLGELARYHQQQLLSNIHARFGAEKIQALQLQLDPDAR